MADRRTFEVTLIIDAGITENIVTATLGRPALVALLRAVADDVEGSVAPRYTEDELRDPNFKRP